MSTHVVACGPNGELLAEIRPGAFYALQVAGRLDDFEVEGIHARWRACAPDDARLLILDGGVELTELDDSRLRKMGLARIELERAA